MDDQIIYLDQDVLDLDVHINNHLLIIAIALIRYSVLSI